MTTLPVAGEQVWSRREDLGGTSLSLPKRKAKSCFIRAGRQSPQRTRRDTAGLLACHLEIGRKTGSAQTPNPSKPLPLGDKAESKRNGTKLCFTVSPSVLFCFSNHVHVVLQFNICIVFQNSDLIPSCIPESRPDRPTWSGQTGPPLCPGEVGTAVSAWL